MNLPYSENILYLEASNPKMSWNEICSDQRNTSIVEISRHSDKVWASIVAVNGLSHSFTSRYCYIQWNFNSNFFINTCVSSIWNFYQLKVSQKNEIYTFKSPFQRFWGVDWRGWPYRWSVKPSLINLIFFLHMYPMFTVISDGRIRFSQLLYSKSEHMH